MPLEIIIIPSIPSKIISSLPCHEFYFFAFNAIAVVMPLKHLHLLPFFQFYSSTTLFTIVSAHRVHLKSSLASADLTDDGAPPSAIIRRPSLKRVRGSCSSGRAPPSRPSQSWRNRALRSQEQNCSSRTSRRRQHRERHLARDPPSAVDNKNMRALISARLAAMSRTGVSFAGGSRPPRRHRRRKGRGRLPLALAVPLSSVLISMAYS